MNRSKIASQRYCSAKVTGSYLLRLQSPIAVVQTKEVRSFSRVISGSSRCAYQNILASNGHRRTKIMLRDRRTRDQFLRFDPGSVGTGSLKNIGSTIVGLIQRVRCTRWVCDRNNRSIGSIGCVLGQRQLNGPSISDNTLDVIGQSVLQTKRSGEIAAAIDHCLACRQRCIASEQDLVVLDNRCRRCEGSRPQLVRSRRRNCQAHRCPARGQCQLNRICIA